jgi:hypothetical protein
VGTQYNSSGLTFTVNAGSNPYVTSDSFTITVAGNTFNGQDPNGNVMTSLAVGTQYNSGGLTFTVSAGSNAYAAGDFFTITMAKTMMLYGASDASVHQPLWGFWNDMEVTDPPGYSFTLLNGNNAYAPGLFMWLQLVTSNSENIYLNGAPTPFSGTVNWNPASPPTSFPWSPGIGVDGGLPYNGYKYNTGTANGPAINDAPGQGSLPGFVTAMQQPSFVDSSGSPITTFALQRDLGFTDYVMYLPPTYYTNTVWLPNGTALQAIPVPVATTVWEAHGACSYSYATGSWTPNVMTYNPSNKGPAVDSNMLTLPIAYPTYTQVVSSKP